MLAATPTAPTRKRDVMSTGYYQLNNGLWIRRSDGSGPYVLDANGAFTLLSGVGDVTSLLPPLTAGNVTGAWTLRPYTRSTIQHVVTGTGVGGCVITVQASNDGVNPIGVPAGLSSFSFNGNTVSDGFELDAPWKYVRTVVSGASGNITSITSLMVS